MLALRPPLGPLAAGLLSCVAAALCCGPAAGAERNTNRFAVLVGITEYEKKAQLRPLNFTEKDVNALAAVLDLYGYEVVLLTHAEGAKDPNRAPTRANIDRELKQAVKKCGAGSSLLLVALSGHGAEFPDESSRGSVNYFCPVDADLNDRKSLLSLADVYNEMGKANGTKVLLVDACRDDPRPKGALSAGKGIDPRHVPTPPKGMVAWFSCSSEQRSFEHPKLEHGFFSYCLLEGLRRDVRDEGGDVPLEGFVVYLPRQVKKEIEAHQPGTSQTPAYRVGESAETSLLRLADLPDKLTHSLGSELVKVPAGTFTLGSPPKEWGRLRDEEPRPVTIPRPFYIGAREVTQAEFQKVMGYNPSFFSEGGPGRARVEKGKAGRYPVEMVTRAEAEAFCRRLSAMPEERALGREYRLPTEAEWEYACRAGTTTAYSFGETLTPAQANFRGSPARGETYRRRPTEVGTFPPNAWKLYDMHGNVAEWCANPSGPYETVAGRPDEAQGSYVLRGGSWFDHAIHCRSAASLREGTDRYLPVAGFRVVWAPGERDRWPAEDTGR